MRAPIDALGAAIRGALTDELVKAEYRANPRPFAGHCYVASEAYFHLAGGKQAGLKAVGVEHEGAQHWWLVDADGVVIDLTAEQFATPVPYQQGRGRGFLTRQPSKRAQVVIDRVLGLRADVDGVGHDAPMATVTDLTARRASRRDSASTTTQAAA